MLLGVDFDCGTFKLAPFDTDAYEDESFYTSYEYCDKPRKVKEMRVIMPDGKTKKIKLRTNSTERK